MLPEYIMIYSVSQHVTSIYNVTTRCRSPCVPYDGRVLQQLNESLQ